jgi:hypothetical protein
MVVVSAEVGAEEPAKGRIWKERNSRVFDSVPHSADDVFEMIREDIRAWRAAG